MPGSFLDDDRELISANLVPLLLGKGRHHDPEQGGGDAHETDPALTASSVRAPDATAATDAAASATTTKTGLRNITVPPSLSTSDDPSETYAAGTFAVSEIPDLDARSPKREHAGNEERVPDRSLRELVRPVRLPSAMATIRARPRVRVSAFQQRFEVPLAQKIEKLALEEASTVRMLRQVNVSEPVDLEHDRPVRANGNVPCLTKEARKELRRLTNHLPHRLPVR